MNLFALGLGIVSLILGIFFLAYGIAAGIMRKRILASHRGDFDVGRSAIVRGIFYVFVGIFFLWGAVVMLWSVAL
jgi:hypothetical protein